MASSSDERRPSPAAILNSLGISPSKRLGQHFLHDVGIVRRIVAASEVPPGSTVIEIGPGLGILTTELAKVAGQVIAVEKDETLLGHLRDTMPANVTIGEADALDFDFSAHSGPGTHVVANLPYNVGNAILRRLQETAPPFESITIMVQREVAERVVASPPQMSLLSVATQFYGAPRIVMRVGKGAFLPPPNVASAVIRIQTHEPPLPADEWERFFDVVRAGFSQRRKQLANTLSRGLHIPKDEVTRALSTGGIPPASRAESLGVTYWIMVYRALDRLRPES